MKIKDKKKFYILLASFLGLTGFLFESPQEDVAEFIRDTQSSLKASKKVKLPPLPEIKPYIPFEYQAGSADPFKMKTFVTDVTSQENTETQKCESTDCADSPPVPHAQFFLETYELDQLRMVGTLSSKKSQLSVLIATPDKEIIKTGVGEYIGKNNGLIKVVDPDHVIIEEKYKVPRGWQNRTATLELFN